MDKGKYALVIRHPNIKFRVHRRCSRFLIIPTTGTLSISISTSGAECKSRSMHYLPSPGFLNQPSPGASHHVRTPKPWCRIRLHTAIPSPNSVYKLITSLPDVHARISHTVYVRFPRQRRIGSNVRGRGGVLPHLHPCSLSPSGNRAKRPFSESSRRRAHTASAKSVFKTYLT